MVQTDILNTTDMTTSASLAANITRHNQWKQHHAAAANITLVISSSTFGGSTQTLGNSTDGQSNFLRANRFKFVGSATAPWTLQVPEEHRVFRVENQTGQTITIDTSGGANPTVQIQDGQTNTIVEDSSQGFELLQGAGTTGTAPYDVAVFMAGGSTVASFLLLKYVYPRTVTIPVDFAASQGHLNTGPAASYSLSIQHNSTEFGTVTFSSGSTVATFSTGSAQVFSSGDILYIVGSSVIDATASDFSITIAGTRG